MEHKIIKTENYLLVVDEDITKAKEGCWIIRNGIEPTFCGEHFFFDFKEPYKKIIAHLPLNNSPILEGVDLLPPLEDDVEKLADEIYPETYYSGLYVDGWLKAGFIKGYNKAKEKYKYTDEDIRKAFDLLIENERLWDKFDSRIIKNKPKSVQDKVEEIIQSLQQPKMPVAFELEHKQYKVKSGTIQEHKDQVAGYEYYEWVGTYKYE